MNHSIPGDGPIPQSDDSGRERALLELGERLAKVAEILGSQSEAAKAAGVSLSQYKRYMAGQNDPAMSSIFLLARKADISLEWLASGLGPMRQSGFSEVSAKYAGPLERDFVIAMLKTMERFFEKKRLQLTADQRTRLFAALYDFAEKELAEGRQPDFAGMLDFFYNSRG